MTRRDGFGLGGGASCGAYCLPVCSTVSLCLALFWSDVLHCPAAPCLGPVLSTFGLGEFRLKLRIVLVQLSIIRHSPGCHPSHPCAPIQPGTVLGGWRKRGECANNQDEMLRLKRTNIAVASNAFISLVPRPWYSPLARPYAPCARHRGKSHETGTGRKCRLAGCSARVRAKSPGRWAGGQAGREVYAPNAPSPRVPAAPPPHPSCSHPNELCELQTGPKVMRSGALARRPCFGRGADKLCET